MSEIEKTLLLRLLSYPEIVLSAANNYAPSVIADYSYGVANLFNNFYENVPVKDSKGGELNFRIALTELTANVLNSSLGILGIEVIKKM
jgi:arginyl-tRNA synthetase